MGIKSFSKVFKETKSYPLTAIKNTRIAVDAMTEIFRAALGGSKVMQLSHDGKPTLHLSVVCSIVCALYSQNVEQIWVFDYFHSAGESFHNVNKLSELNKRRAKKEKAKEKLADLLRTQDLFDDESTNDSTVNAVEKAATTVTQEQIKEVLSLLDSLSIKWCIAPAGFEGECVASYLNKVGEVDAVLSADTDCIAYGAKKLIRRKPGDKKLYEYELSDCINQIDESATIKDLRKVAAILGTDVCEKTPGIGPSSVFKKYKFTSLTTSQEQAIQEFEKKPRGVEIQNAYETPLNVVDDAIDYLVESKGFSRESLIMKFDKAKNTLLKSKNKVKR